MGKSAVVKSICLGRSISFHSGRPATEIVGSGTAGGHAASALAQPGPHQAGEEEGGQDQAGGGLGRQARGQGRAQRREAVLLEVGEGEGLEPPAAQEGIGAPQVSAATIELGGQRAFTIEAPGLSPVNRYVTGAALNGAPLMPRGINGSGHVVGWAEGAAAVWPMCLGTHSKASRNGERALNHVRH